MFIHSNEPERGGLNGVRRVFEINLVFRFVYVFYVKNSNQNIDIKENLVTYTPVSPK